jgi:6-phosphogluconate dehydrogenase (decarboxylating)
MELGMIRLGRMGTNLVQRLSRAGHPEKKATPKGDIS